MLACVFFYLFLVLGCCGSCVVWRGSTIGWLAIGAFILQGLRDNYVCLVCLVGGNVKKLELIYLIFNLLDWKIN